MDGFVASILVNEVAVAEVRIEVGAITSALPSPTADDDDVDDGMKRSNDNDSGTHPASSNFSSGGGNTRHIRQMVRFLSRSAVAT
jgi:hypothetical protein